jgi:DNA-binding CsgD family transcriptional regulator
MLPSSLADRLSPNGRSRHTSGHNAPLEHAIELTPHADQVRGRGASDAERSASARALLHVFDLLAEGVLLVDAAGGMFYRNPALEHVLLEDGDRGALLREMRQLALGLPRAGARNGDAAHDLGPGCMLARETRTATARYRMRAAPLDDALLGSAHSAIVMLERLTPVLPSATALADRYNLTAAEAGVAVLLAQGHSNGTIAKLLEISPHTARHHTESVLLKLNVHSRAEVGGKVLGTRRPSGPMPAL